MNEKIELVQTSDMLCLEAAMATIATWWNLSYEMIFSCFWDFYLLPTDVANPQTLGKRLMGFNNINQADLLKRYHNIQIDCRDYENDINDTINRIQNNHPRMTLIKHDLRPWANPNDYPDDFGIILIYGYDKESTGFYCIDIHNSKKQEFLPLDNFIKGIENVFSFQEFSKLASKNNHFNWKEEIQNHLSRLVGNKNDNSFVSILSFAEMIGNFNIQYEECDKFLDTDFFNRIKDICRARKLYPMALRYMGMEYKVNKLQRVAEDYQKTASKWGLINGTLTKYGIKSQFMQPDSFNKISADISLILRDIATEEREIFDRLQEMIANDEMAAELSGQPDVKRAKYYHCLELDQYFNNKAFAFGNQKADLTGLKKYFLNDGLPENGVLNYGEMKFMLKNCRSVNNDNLILEGQVIYFNEKKVLGFQIVGLSEYGSYDGEILVYFINGNVESINAIFPDVHLNLGHEVIWQGNTYDGIFKRAEQANLYVNEYFLIASGMDVVSLKLPFLPHSHIFAINVLK
ncbi:MAG: hypothetical protein FWG91_11650 [Lachnospiraceae bacterium]|nr:hypothetical protein [Lachnospiraceae bacterium]